MARLVVSQNERLLLHLMELERFRDEPEVPLGASQEGIAKALQTQIHNASRALTSLEREGLVLDRLAHVRGAPKRRRAYFLTDKGRRAAEAFRKDVANRKIVLDEGGRAHELAVDEALRKVTMLTGRPVALTELVEVARETDVVTLDRFEKPAPARDVGKPLLVVAHGRPKVELFFGREQELKKLDDVLSGREPAAVLLWGIPGIGKSTFASRAFEERIGKAPLFWFTFREWDTAGSFLGALGEFLRKLKPSGTAPLAHAGKAPGDLFAPMTKNLEDSGALIFLDDVHKASEHLGVLVSILTEAAKASGSAIVVMISRTVPSFFSANAPGNIRLELRGLDRNAAWRLAESAKARDVARAVDESHGHPLLLRLMSRSGASTAKGDVTAFIEQEVYTGAADDERRVLELLSVFRHPVPPEALGGMDYDAVAGLRQKALVTEDESGLWTHEILRDFFGSRLRADRRKELHEQAGAFCERQANPEWVLEALYHFVHAQLWTDAVRLLNTHADDLAGEFPEETLELISAIPAATGDVYGQAETLFLKGQLNETMGRHEEALIAYKNSLSLVGEDDKGGRIAVIHEAMGKLQTIVEKWTESLESHQKALELYEKNDDKAGMMREWMNIGAAHRKKGDYVRAREAYGNALSVATRREDRSAQAACLNNLALLDWDEGRLREAETRLKESIRLSHAVRDHAGEARALENLAELARSRIRTAEVTSLLREASEAFRRAGEMGEFKRLTAESARALGDEGKGEKGVDLCRKALERPELRRRRGLFQKTPRYDDGDIALRTALIELLHKSGDIRGAARESERFLEVATSLGNQSLMARAKLELALIGEDSGDLASAVKYLDEAEVLLRSAGDRNGLVAVHIRRGMVEEKLGKEAVAVEHYEEAVRQAETEGNRLALASSLENLALAIGADDDEGKGLLDRAIEIYSELGMLEESEKLKRILRE